MYWSGFQQALNTYCGPDPLSRVLLRLLYVARPLGLLDTCTGSVVRRSSTCARTEEKYCVYKPLDEAQLLQHDALHANATGVKEVVWTVC